MCRNIRNLHNFDPPTTDDEVHDAALQFVRKISGSTKPSKAERGGLRARGRAGRRGLARAARLAGDRRAAQGPRGRGRQGARPRPVALRRVTAARVPSPSPYAPVIGFSAAVRAGDLVFVAGMTAVTGRRRDRRRGRVHPGARGAAQGAVRRSRRAGARLEAGGPDAHVPGRRRRLGGGRPRPRRGLRRVRPAAAMLVTGLLDPRMRVEIEAVAHSRTLGDRVRVTPP